MKTLEKIIIGMLTENTGRDALDSGDFYGRSWEKNQGHDFKSEPVVTWDADCESSDGLCQTVSLYHYLTSGFLELDEFCEKFNEIQENSNDWDFCVDDGNTFVYGVSEKAGKYLVRLEAEFKNAWNTYNGENFLSQILQGSYVTLPSGKYVLLQIHGGCDVRGGYTDAKLFKFTDEDLLPYVNPTPHVSGTIDGVYVSTGYDGWSLTNEDGEHVKVTPDSEIELECSFDY